MVRRVTHSLFFNRACVLCIPSSRARAMSRRGSIIPVPLATWMPPRREPSLVPLATWTWTPPGREPSSSRDVDASRKRACRGGKARRSSPQGAASQAQHAFLFGRRHGRRECEVSTYADPGQQILPVVTVARLR